MFPWSHEDGRPVPHESRLTFNASRHDAHVTSEHVEGPLMSYTFQFGRLQRDRTERWCAVSLSGGGAMRGLML